MPERRRDGSCSYGCIRPAPGEHAPVGVADLELHRRELTGYCRHMVGAQDGVRSALAAALGQLPARQRAALILCEVLRWRSDEAAQVLGTTTVAVASSLQRARATLARPSGPRTPSASMPISSPATRTRSGVMTSPRWSG